MQSVLATQQWSSPVNKFVSAEPGDPDVAAYRTSYAQAFSELSPAERYTIRDWTHVDGAQEQYVDEIGGVRITDQHAYQGTNYDLNAYLHRSGTGTPDPTYETAASRLYNALSKLPMVPLDDVPLLRVADVDADYASRFQVGDLVTNGRAFMSAASNNDYASESLIQGYAAEGRTGGMAIYEFNAATAVPTLPGITTLAEHETEWLFSPYRVFQVDEMASTRINSQSASNLPLTAMRLTEVSLAQPTMAKSLHGGEPVWVTPEDRVPPPLPSPFIPVPGPGDSASSGYSYTSPTSPESD